MSRSLYGYKELQFSLQKHCKAICVRWEICHYDLAKLHLFHKTCWVDSTLGSPDWTFSSQCTGSDPDCTFSSQCTGSDPDWTFSSQCTGSDHAVWTLHWVVQTVHSVHGVPARIMLLLEWLLGGAVSAYSYWVFDMSNCHLSVLLGR